VSERILVVEDEPAIRDVVAFALRGEGYEVVEADDGEVALERALREPFDLVLLDVMLPGLPGTEVCRRLRAEGDGDVPVIMLSARGGELDRVLGLETGADDYVAKPFSTPELQARVRALLRRRRLDRGGGGVRRVGGLELDLERLEVELDGRTVSLTPSEGRLLATLAATPDRPVPREELVRALWTSDYTGDRRACDTHVANLRRKLERDPAQPERLVTVRGIGYALRSV
jgi:two-component system response regulator RegX3